MRVLVCGGRDLTDRDLVYNELNALRMEHGWLTIIEGGCPTGGDKFARDWAHANYCGLVTIEANWKEYGRQAGPLRNARMLKFAKPEKVRAFPSPVRGLEGTGTGDMVRRARDAGVEVRVIGLEKKGLFE